MIKHLWNQESRILKIRTLSDTSNMAVEHELDQDSVSTPVITGSPTSLETILQNSSHGKNITVCMGIFMICFRKHKNYKTFHNNTLSYFHGHGVRNLCITCRLAIFESFSSPSFHQWTGLKHIVKSPHTIVFQYNYIDDYRKQSAVIGQELHFIPL